MPNIDKPLKRMIQLTTGDWVKYLSLDEPEAPVEHIEILTEIAVPQSSLLDAVVLCTDSKGEKFIFDIEPQGYFDDAIAPRMLRYTGAIWEYTVAKKMGKPLIKQIVIVLYEKDKNMEHTLQNRWENKGKLIYEYFVINAWELDRDIIIKNRLVGLYPLLSILKTKANETVDQLMKVSTAAISEVEDEALRCEVFAVFSILGSGVYSKELIKKYVRRQDVMNSDLIMEWTQEDRDEAVAEAVAEAVKETTLIATVNITRKKTLDALVARFNRIPKRIRSRLEFIDRLELLDQLHQKAVLVPSMDEFENELNQAEKEQDAYVQ